MLHLLKAAALSVLPLLLLASPAMADLPEQGWETGRFEVGPRLTHLTLRDIETEAELPMGGLGAYVRYRSSRRWGVEAAVDAVMADELGKTHPGEVTRVTTPATIAAMFYLWPDNDGQFYILCGVGSADHEVEFAALGEIHTWTTPLSTFGFGFQYRTESIRYDASLRALTFHEAMFEDRTVSKLETGQRRDAGYAPYQAPRSLSGAMLNLGVNWGW
jgi:hypothetical protein